MKGLAWIGVIVVIVLVVAGLLLYRSTAPEGDVVPEGEAMLEETEDGSLAPGQFIQTAPAGLPGAEDNDDAGLEPAAEPSPAAIETDADSGGQEVTISMTDAGFVPGSVSIGLGDTVTFINNGQALHWPASNVHPTHEILPAFDSDRGIATGSSYSYTFEEAGIWKFHDHLNPQFTGTVTVE